MCLLRVLWLKRGVLGLNASPMVALGQTYVRREWNQTVFPDGSDYVFFLLGWKLTILPACDMDWPSEHVPCWPPVYPK